MIGLHELGRLTVAVVFLVLAAAATAQTLTVFIGLRLRLARSSAERFYRNIMRAHWGYGRWLLGAASIRWLGDQGFAVFVAALIVSLDGLGGLRAAQTIVRPVTLTFVALGTFFVPRMSASAARGRVNDVVRTSRMLRRAFFGIAGCGFLVSLLLGGPGLEFLFGEEFRRFSWIVSSLLVGTAVGGIAEADGITLRSIGHTKGVFIGHFIRALVALGVGIPLGLIYGLSGIVVAMVSATACRTLVIRVIARREVVKHRIEGDLVIPT